MTDKEKKSPQREETVFKPIVTEKKKSGIPAFLGLVAGAAVIGAGGWYVYSEIAPSPPAHPPVAAEKKAPAHRVKAFFQEKSNPFTVFHDVKNHFSKTEDAAPPSPPVIAERSKLIPPAPPPFHHAPPAPPPADVIAPASAVEERLLALEAQMDAVVENITQKQQTFTPATTPQTNDMVLMQLHNLQEKIDRLQQEQNARKDLFNERLRAISLIEQLENDVETGNDFGETITRLAPMSASLGFDEAALGTLQQAAQASPPSLAALMEGFNAAARNAAPYAKGDESTFSMKLQEALAPVLTIRRVDVETSDTSDEAHIARAEAELKAGNVGMALTHIRQLSPATRDYFETWVAEAKQFQNLAHAVAALKTAAHQPE